MVEYIKGLNNRGGKERSKTEVHQEWRQVHEQAAKSQVNLRKHKNTGKEVFLQILIVLCTAKTVSATLGLWNISSGLWNIFSGCNTLAALDNNGHRAQRFPRCLAGCGAQRPLLR